MPEENHGQPQQRGPQPHSPRVQAWIRRVINPLIDAVDFEISALERGSLTWRFYNRKSEHLKPIAAYVSESRRSYEDLLRARGEKIEPLIAEHDKLLVSATREAALAHDSVLTPGGGFAALVSQRLSDYMKTRDPTKRPSGAFEPDQLPALMADRLINNDGADVGFPYTDAEFWNLNRDAFLPYSLEPSFEKVREAVRALSRHDRALLGELKNLHYELVEEFDVEPD